MPDPLDDALGRFTQESLLQLFGAAACSPGCAARWPSVLICFERALRRPRGAGRKATPADLRLLLTAARKSRAEVHRFEDYLPHDPRWQVRVRLLGGLYAIHPGGSEMPVGEIRNHLHLAEVLDPLLGASHGFGIADLVELVLRYMDSCVSQLTNVWSDLPQKITTRVKLTDAEVRAINDVAPIATHVGSCTSPVRAAAALRWATRPVADFSVQFGIDMPAVPAALQLEGVSSPIPIPLAFTGDALGACVAALCEELAQANPQAEEVLRDGMQSLVARLFDRLHRDVIGPWSWRAGEMTLAIPYAGRRCLLVDVASGLRPQATMSDFDQRHAALGQVAADEVFVAGPIEIRLDHRVEVVKALIVAGPVGIRTNEPGVAVMTLTDLEWILRHLEPDNDFYFFCRELCEPQGVANIFSWSAADAWLAWKVYGGLYAGGEPLELAYITPGAGEADWLERIGLRQLETVLARYRLPSVDEWWYLDNQKSETLLVRQRPYEMWMVRPFEPAVAVRVADSNSSQQSRWMIDLAQSLLIRTNCPEMQQVLDCLGVDSIAIFLVSASHDGSAAIAARMESDLQVEMSCDLQRIRNGEFSGEELQAALGTSLCGALKSVGDHGVSQAAGALEAVWLASPPSVLFHRSPLYQAAQELDDPLSIPASMRKHWRRELGRLLRTEGVKSRRVSQRDYADFELKEIYPRFIGLLRARLSQYAGDSLLPALAAEMERTVCQRHQQRIRLIGTVALPEAEFRIQRLQEIQEKATRQSRGLGLLIEEVVANHPAGGLRPDEIDLVELIALADLCLESALMRQSAAYGLQRIEALLSKRHELTRKLLGQGRADLVAWQRADAEGAVRSPKAEEPLNVNTVPLEIPPMPRELGPIDGALRIAYGCGLMAIFACLTEGRTWPVTDDKPVARTTRAAFARYVCDSWPIPKGEILAAIDLLSLRKADLAREEDSKGRLEHWKMESRAYRLATRPFVSTLSGELLVMPWRIGMSHEVYLSYYSDGRLPWPEAATDARVTTTLKSYRRSRNRELEADVAHELGRLGLPFRKNVDHRKPHLIGLATLTGEIDALAADPKSKTLWVIEAKDVGAAFSPPELARSIASFHDPGGYVDKLMRKTRDVMRNPGAVARALGCPAASRWRVKALMVTRRIEPSAFVPCAVPFVTIDTLPRVLAMRVAIRRRVRVNRAP